MSSQLCSKMTTYKSACYKTAIAEQKFLV